MSAQKGGPPGRRAVFVDVDGTLTDHGIIDPTAIDAIRSARAAGHLVFISTGRAHGEISPEVLGIGFDGEISNGGSFVRLGDDLLVARPMTEAAVARLMDYFERRGLPYFFQTDLKLYGNRAMIDIFTDFWEHLKITRAGTIAALGVSDNEVAMDSMPEDARERVGPLEDLIEPDGALGPTLRNEVARAVFLSPESAEAEEDAIDQASADLSDEFHLAAGSMPAAIGRSGELSPRGITKGAAVAAVLDHLGIDASDAVSIGDSWNDVEMFDVCGVSVAMGNASPEVAARADRVTAPVLHGGVRDALADLGLI